MSCLPIRCPATPRVLRWLSPAASRLSNLMAGSLRGVSKSRSYSVLATEPNDEPLTAPKLDAVAIDELLRPFGGILFIGAGGCRYPEICPSFPMLRRHRRSAGPHDRVPLCIPADRPRGSWPRRQSGSGPIPGRFRIARAHTESLGLRLSVAAGQRDMDDARGHGGH
jgi:hypothetical protein